MTVRTCTDKDIAESHDEMTLREAAEHALDQKKTGLVRTFCDFMHQASLVRSGSRECHALILRIAALYKEIAGGRVGFGFMPPNTQDSARDLCVDALIVVATLKE